MKNNRILLKNLLHLALILLGNAIYALAVTMFILPAGLITGGTTGLALFFFHQFGLPVTVFVSVFNVASVFTGTLDPWKKIRTDHTSQHLLLSVYPGGFSKDPGADANDGRSAVMRRLCRADDRPFHRYRHSAGASTGGMDIPPLVLNKKLGLSVSATMYVFDFTILLLQILFSDKEQVLYGILLVMIYTLVLDKVLLMGQSRTQVKIISQKYEQINEQIIRRLDRGSTLIQAADGLLPGRAADDPVSNFQSGIASPDRLVNEIDPAAFLVVSAVKEVRGRGFSLSKEYR